MKKIIPYVMAMTVFISMTVAAFAANAVDKEPPEKGLLFINADKVGAELTIKSGEAFCNTEVIGKKGTTKIAITMSLQRKKKGTWITVKNWSGSKGSAYYTMTKTASVNKGTYRVKSVANVYKDSKCETITKYSSTVS